MSDGEAKEMTGQQPVDIDENLYLKSAGLTPDGKFEMVLQSSVVPIIARQFLDLLDAAKAPNYLETVYYSDKGRIVVTVQLASGETPASQAARYKARCERMEAVLRMCAEDGECECGPDEECATCLSRALLEAFAEQDARAVQAGAKEPPR